MTLNSLSLWKISTRLNINADLKKIDEWYEFIQMKRN